MKRKSNTHSHTHTQTHTLNVCTINLKCEIESFELQTRETGHHEYALEEQTEQYMTKLSHPKCDGSRGRERENEKIGKKERKLRQLRTPKRMFKLAFG